MATQIEIIARLRDEVTARMKAMSGAAKELQGSLKESLQRGIQSSLPYELGFIADKLDLLPAAATAAGGALLVAGSAAVSMAKNVADTAIQFDQLAQRTGTSVEFLSGFTAVAGDAEIGAESVGNALQLLSRNLAETGAQNVSVQQELMALADTFKAMPDGPQKTALAMQAFGRSGAEMIPLLNQGSEAIKAMMVDAQNMGRVMSQETVAAASAFDDAMDKLNGQLEGFRNNVGGAVLPAITEVLTGINSLPAGIALVSQAFQELTSQGQISALAMLQLKIAALDVQIAIATLNPMLIGQKTLFEGMRDATYKEVDALKQMQSGTNATTGAASTFNSVLATMGPNAMRQASLAKGASAIFFQAAQGFAAGVKLMDSSRASAARYAGMARDIQYEQGLVKAKSTSANASRYAAQAEVYRVEAMGKATRQTDMLTVATDAMNRGLDWSAASAGGAAAAVDEVTDSVKELQEAQRSVGGMLGQSLTEMDELARVQTAYALATGELSAEQFAQQQAVKALMQAVKDKQVSEDKAVTTAMALAQGLASVTDVYAIAGPAGQKFADEQGKVQGAADAAATKVNELATAVKKIPNNWEVDVVATVLGMGQVENAKKVLDDLHDRQYTAYVNVVYRQSGLPPPGGAGGGSGGGNSWGGNDPEGSGAMGISNARAGSSYIVGENGPEVFTPNSNGKVTPNHRLNKSSSNIPIIIQLDGRTIARTVAEHLK